MSPQASPPPARPRPRAAAGRRFASGLAVPAVVTIPGLIALLVFALPIMGLLFAVLGAAGAALKGTD